MDLSPLLPASPVDEIFTTVDDVVVGLIVEDEFAGDGIRVDTSLKYTFTLVKYGTILYQKG